MPPFQFTPRAIISLIAALMLPAVASAGDRLPADQPIPQAIDHYIGAALQSAKVKPAQNAADYEFLRRVTLDLAGRIPTDREVRDYVASNDPKKREKLIDRLLASPGFQFHQRNWLDELLLENKKNDREWREYLLKAVQENRPWDQLFREMMTARDEKSKPHPALTFLKVRARSRDDMAVDTSRLFFGVNISCAKCHDHPLVEDWKQDHFYGFSSFFDRTYLTSSNLLAEKSFGEVTFKTTAGQEKTANVMFLTGTVVKSPDVKLSKAEIKKREAAIRKVMKDKNAPPPKPPEFSLREKLVEVGLKSAENQFFSRNIVNRVWKRFFGRGIVAPVDQMHSGNSPSHPELLDWLQRDLVAHKYDLKRLIRGIVLSDAYGRSSRWSGTGEPPPAHLFAVASPRTLTPRQFALSLLIATTSPTSFPKDMKSKEWAKQRENLERAAEGFAGQIEYPGEHFQVSVDEALLFMNNDRIRNDFLRDSGDKLVGYLKAIPDDRQLIDTAYRAVLSRGPAEEEMTVFLEYLKDRKDRRPAGIQQIVWALLTGPEMRFNY